MDLLMLVFLEIVYVLVSHFVLFIFYGIGLLSRKPGAVMGWYVAGRVLHAVPTFGMFGLIRRTQNGVPTMEQILTLIGTIFICVGFYFIMRRRADKLEKKQSETPVDPEP